jgi:hypothetical protein
MQIPPKNSIKEKGNVAWVKAAMGRFVALGMVLADWF